MHIKTMIVSYTLSHEPSRVIARSSDCSWEQQAITETESGDCKLEQKPNTGATVLVENAISSFGSPALGGKCVVLFTRFCAYYKGFTERENQRIHHVCYLRISSTLNGIFATR